MIFKSTLSFASMIGRYWAIQCRKRVTMILQNSILASGANESDTETETKMARIVKGNKGKWR